MSLKDFFGNMGSFFGLEEGEDDQEIAVKQPSQPKPKPQPKQPATRSFQQVPPTQQQSRVQSPAQGQKGAARESQRAPRMEPQSRTQSNTSQRKPQKSEKKVVTMPSDRKGTRTRGAMNDSSGTIMILEPRVYSEAMKIAKHVMSGNSVLVNFHLMEEYQARRVVDFLTGTVYAEDGDIKRVSDEMFLCTPKTVEIEGAAKSLVQHDMFDLSEMSL